MIIRTLEEFNLEYNFKFKNLYDLYYHNGIAIKSSTISLFKNKISENIDNKNQIYNQLRLGWSACVYDEFEYEKNWKFILGFTEINDFDKFVKYLKLEIFS